MMIFESKDNIIMKQVLWEYDEYDYRIIPGVSKSKSTNGDPYFLDTFKKDFVPETIYSLINNNFGNNFQIDFFMEVYYFRYKTDLLLFKLLVDENVFTDPN